MYTKHRVRFIPATVYCNIRRYTYVMDTSHSVRLIPRYLYLDQCTVTLLSVCREMWLQNDYLNTFDLSWDKVNHSFPNHNKFRQ